MDGKKQQGEPGCFFVSYLIKKGREKTLEGYLLLHGFAGSPADLQPVAQMLKQEGRLLRCPVLAGHGSGRDRMRTVSWEDWVDSAEGSLIQLKDVTPRVNVIGFSLGALIGVMLSQRQRIHRLILLSPPALPTAQELIQGATEVARGPLAIHRRMGSGASIKEYFRRLTRSPVQAIHELYQLMKAVEPVYGELDMPVLIIHGAKDELAHPRGARRVYEQIPSEEKRLVILPHSRHLILKDDEVEQVLKEVRSFLTPAPSLV